MRVTDLVNFAAGVATCAGICIIRITSQEVENGKAIIGKGGSRAIPTTTTPCFIGWLYSDGHCGFCV